MVAQRVALAAKPVALVLASARRRLPTRRNASAGELLIRSSERSVSSIKRRARS